MSETAVALNLNRQYAETTNQVRDTRLKDVTARRVRKPPRVFLSSVIRGLEECRTKIRRLIEDRGWTCLDSTAHPGFGGTPTACLNLVDEGDLYLGLFYERTGTVEPIELLPITELEFYRALYRKPMRLYVLRSHAPEPRLRLFLDFWSGNFFGGVWFTTCPDQGSLLQQISRDLDHFEILYASGETNNWVVPPLPRSLPSQLVLPHRRPYGRLHIKSIEDAIQRASNSYTSNNHADVIAQAARIFGTLWPPKTDPESGAWLELLRIWCHAALWMGFYPFAIWASLLSRELMVRHRRFASFCTVCSNIALSYYVCAERVKANTAWSDQKQGELNVSKRLYEIALVADELARQQQRGPTPYLHRAYELSALGEHDKAIEDFKEIERMEGGNGVWHAHALASLGRAYARKRQFLKAGQHLDLAMSKIINQLKTPLAVSTGASIAEGYIELGEVKTGCELCEQLVRLASEAGLADQEFKIRSLLRWANA